MTTKKMTRQQEHDFFADPDNQTPQGPARRRRSKLSEPVPVRFPPETLAKIRDAADADDRSVSSWIRRAVDHELDTTPRPPEHPTRRQVLRACDTERSPRA